MKLTKRIICGLLTTALAVASLTACGDPGTTSATSNNSHGTTSETGSSNTISNEDLSLKVTSANSTAHSFHDIIEQFLVDCDTKGYGMQLSEKRTTEITISIKSTGWTVAVTNADTSFKNGATSLYDDKEISWETAGTEITASDTAINHAQNPRNLLAIRLIGCFPDIKQGYVKAYARAGNVEAVVFTTYTDNETHLADDLCAAKYDADGNLQKVEGVIDWKNGIAKWDGRTAGISANGLLVGTCPALNIGNVD